MPSAASARATALLAFAHALLTVRGECLDSRVSPQHSDEGRLRKDLFCAYDKELRPIKDHTKTTVVAVGMSLKYLSLDEMEETLTIQGHIRLQWKDEYLTWNPSDYGDISRIEIRTFKLWTPSWQLFNADASKKAWDMFFTTCLLYYDGSVTCVPHQSNTAMCVMKLRSWPYDTQNCSFSFASWVHTGEKVNYTFTTPPVVDLQDFQNGPGWLLQDVKHSVKVTTYTCCPSDTYPMLRFHFELRRVAAGVASIVVVLSITIVTMTLSSLLLDVKDNTRLTLVCFSLFSHFIFLILTEYIIPQHSTDTPAILLFLRDSMQVTLVGVLLTLFLMSLRTRTMPPPMFISAINHLVAISPGKYVVFTNFDMSTSNSEASEGAESRPAAAPSARADWTQFSNILNSYAFALLVAVYFVLLILYLPREP